MRSTCSCVASPSCTSRSASSPNGRPQRLTRKPGPSAASITRRPIARPSSRARLERRLARPLARDHLDSFMTGAGLKKCMPTTRSGARHARRDLGDAQRRRVGGEHAVLAHDRASSREQLALELERLRRRLDHDVGVGQRAERRRRLERPGRARLEPALLDLALEPLGDAGQPALERSGVGIVHERARARRRGELRDAGAHRAGAEDSDDHYEGTSAFSPMIIRRTLARAFQTGGGSG